jgi:hyperosmotically inducible periplasmic protein
MKNPLNARSAAWVAALAAVAATAWAASDTYYSSSPASTTAVTTTSGLAPGETVVTHETVIADEPVAPAPAPATRPVVIEQSVQQPPITIEQRRLTLDERIQADVMDALLHAKITGHIGVESRDAAVTLTGWTATAGQARRAEMYAHVSGVTYVDNQIRPRVGSI